jgi:hypothetical protein
MSWSELDPNRTGTRTQVVGLKNDNGAICWARACRGEKILRPEINPVVNGTRKQRRINRDSPVLELRDAEQLQSIQRGRLRWG